MASSKRATGKIATSILLDVSELMGHESEEDGKSFFDKAIACASRIVLRQIFSGDHDEISIIIFGSDETDNSLADNSKNYQNICVLSRLCVATWDDLDKIRILKQSSVTQSKWTEALIVALDSLKTSTEGRKFKYKQIVLLSNFSSKIYFTEDNLETLVNVINDYDVKLLAIGASCRKEKSVDEIENMNLLQQLIHGLNSGTSMTFQEAEEELKLYIQKRISPRKLPVLLEIGSEIKIPVCWIKLNREQKVAAEWKEASFDPELANIKEWPSDNRSSALAPGINYSMVTDEAKTAYYGATEVPLSYADLEAMKRKTSNAMFTLIACTKRKNVTPLMYVGTDIYVVQPKANDKSSVATLSAFVDALIQSERVAIAKRVLTKNGKINIGALVPVSDELGKHLYFLKLPTAEWVRQIPTVTKQFPTNDQERLSAVDEFIDSKLLPTDLYEKDRGVLMPNPSFQNYCHLLAMSWINDELEEYKEDEGLKDIPTFVKEILEPVPGLTDQSEAALLRLNVLFPIKPKPQPIIKHKRTNRNMDNDYELYDDVRLTEKEEDELMNDLLKQNEFTP